MTTASPADEADEPDPDALDGALQIVANAIGTTPTEEAAMGAEELNRALIRVRTRHQGALWDATREALIAERLMALLAPFPADTTIEGAIAAGLVSEEDAAWAMDPTHDEIAAALGAVPTF